MENKEKSPKFRFCLAAALAAAALCLAVYLFTDPYDGRILDNTWIAGVEVSGMTRGEARKALGTLKNKFSQEPMIVALPEQSVHLLPENTKISLNVSAAVKAAYAYGRSGTKEEQQAAYEASHTQAHTIDLRPYLTWNEEAILTELEAYAAQYNTVYSPSSYHLEGDAPALDENSVQNDTPVQTLVISMGTPGFLLDVSTIYEDILNTYSAGSLLLDRTGIQPDSVPAAPDLEAIYQELYTAPADAALDTEAHRIIPASYGYSFDLENARRLASDAVYGDTLRIPMTLTAPQVLADDLYFRDVLGTYVSGHSDRPNIIKNLQLVCQFLNGIIIQPGEVFSYNEAIGERTVERGFMYGDSFSGFERTQSAGGGVCQGSSVLHVCVLEADLEVVERVCHGMVVGYTPLGQDAAVSWPGPDFRFRNSTNFPIRIEAVYTDKDIQMKLMGTDERDYYIVLEATEGHDDHQIYANCYKRKYDKETGELISRELAAHSAYKYGG